MGRLVNIINTVYRSRGNLIKVNFVVNDNEFQAFVPDDQYFIAIKDILLNRVYEHLPDFELINFIDKRIVDAGAHTGLFSLLASNFAKEVITIEPHPFIFKILELNKLINNRENIVCLNKALWNKNTKTTLYEAEISSDSTLIPSYKQESNKRYEIDTITLGILLNVMVI